MVYLFLGEECIISQNFTLRLRQLHETFASDRIEFLGLFPNPSSTQDKMAAFQKKYQIPFACKLDKMQRKMDEFGVRVTPEVVVYNTDKQAVMYQGRIDNSYVRVGKRRTITTTFELKDVLTTVVEGKEIAVKKTTAVGCFITPLSTDLKNMPMCKEQ